MTEKELVAAFSEYGEVISVSLRSKGGEFDCKSWALLTFSTAEAAGRALFGTTTVIDEAFDEVSLKVKRADIDERLGGKGQLSTIVQQQNSRVKKVEARREKKERKSEIEEELDKRRDTEAREDPSCARSNKTSMPFNPINLQYCEGREGECLKYSDEALAYRNACRADHLQRRNNGGYDPITGEEMQRVQVPKPPQAPSFMLG